MSSPAFATSTSYRPRGARRLVLPFALLAFALEACIVVASAPATGTATVSGDATGGTYAAERDDHHCGPSFGGAVCGANRCCSQFDWCGGLNEDHCNGAHGYGGQYDGPRISSGERDDHHCGPNFGGASCGPDRCCSQFDWCGGLNEDHCNGAHGYGGQYDGPRVSGGGY